MNRQYGIASIKDYTKKDFSGNSKTYKKMDDIIAHFWSNNTKDLLRGSGARVSWSYNNTVEQLAKKIQDDRLAIFPINSTTYLSDILSWVKMGFKIVFMTHKDYKEFKKEYMSIM